MKKIKVVVAVVLLISTAMLTLCSCNIFGEKVTPEDVKNQVIGEATEYLKENYPDDEFTYVSGRSPNWAYNYYELGFTSKKYDNQELTVFGEPDNETYENKTIYNYYDDYFKYYMLADAEKYFYDLAKQYLEEDIDVAVTFYTGIGYAKSVDSNMNFIKNTQNNKVSYSVKIFVSYATEDNINELKKVFKIMTESIAEKNIKSDIIYIFDNGIISNGSNFIEYSIDNGIAKEKKQ